MRWIFSNIGPLFPALLGKWAYRTWFSTRRFKAPRREQPWIANAASQQQQLAGIPVMTYRWGDSSKPLVVLVHGWNGRGSQMAAFAEPLVQAGFRVLSYDAPGHAHTPGSNSNIFEMSKVLNAIAQQLGPIHGIVAHSFGGMVTSLALSQGLTAKRVVLISTPARFEFLIDLFVNGLRMPPAVKHNLVNRLKTRFGDRVFDEVSTQQTCAQLAHIPALIIHDEKDHDVPLEQALLINQSWPGSRLFKTRGLGHKRVLYNHEVIKQVSHFLQS